MQRNKLLALVRREQRINEKDDAGIDEFIKRRDREKKSMEKI